MKKLAILVLSIAMLSSCVSKKKFLELQGNRDDLQRNFNQLQADYQKCENDVAVLQGDLDVRASMLEEERSEYRALEEKLERFQQTNTNMLQRLSDMSIVDEAGAESIKKSLAVINEQNQHISDLKTSIQRKDSLNTMLLRKLKRSLAGIDDKDVSVEVKKGVVYISLSDKLLFKSGSSRINPAADSVLAEIAKVINDHKNFDVLVEGHTDDVPIGNINCIEDNWDLSAKRAVAVVRELQKEYNVAPERLTAGGKSYYAPKTANDSKEGRSQNRRTEIVILPKLDQFFQLMEPVSETADTN